MKKIASTSSELAWSQVDKRRWDCQGLRITQVGIGADNSIRYYCYKDGKVLGSEPTLDQAKMLCVSGKFKVLEGSDLDVPTDLLMTKAQRAAARATAKSASPSATQTDRRDARKPKSMSWADWDAHLAVQQPRADSVRGDKDGYKREDSTVKADATSTKARRNAGTIAAQGLLTAHHFAAKLDCEAKLVRRALRTTKAIAKPECGWAFPASQEQAVLAVVSAWLAKQGGGRLKASKVKPAQKAINVKSKKKDKR